MAPRGRASPGSSRSRRDRRSAAWRRRRGGTQVSAWTFAGQLPEVGEVTVGVADGDQEPRRGAPQASRPPARKSSGSTAGGAGATEPKVEGDERVVACGPPVSRAPDSPVGTSRKRGCRWRLRRGLAGEPPLLRSIGSRTSFTEERESPCPRQEGRLPRRQDRPQAPGHGRTGRGRAPLQAAGRRPACPCSASNRRGEDVSTDARELYRDVPEFVKDAERDSGKLGKALQRDIEKAHKRMPPARRPRARAAPAHHARPQLDHRQAHHVAVARQVAARPIGQWHPAALPRREPACDRMAKGANEPRPVDVCRQLSSSRRRRSKARAGTTTPARTSAAGSLAAAARGCEGDSAARVAMHGRRRARRRSPTASPTRRRSRSPPRPRRPRRGCARGRCRSRPGGCSTGWRPGLPPGQDPDHLAAGQRARRARRPPSPRRARRRRAPRRPRPAGGRPHSAIRPSSSSGGAGADHGDLASRRLTRASPAGARRRSR